MNNRFAQRKACSFRWHIFLSIFVIGLSLHGCIERPPKPQENGDALPSADQPPQDQVENPPMNDEPPPGDELPSNGEGTFRIARDLRAEAHCNTATAFGVRADMSWTPAGARTTAQNVEIRVVSGSAETIVWVERMDAESATLEWTRARSSTVYVWQVYTCVAEICAASATARFGSPACTLPPPDPTPILSFDSRRSATSLTSDPGCDSNVLQRGIAQLRWTPSLEGGSAQRVDVSTSATGISSGILASSSSLVAGAGGYEWLNTEPGAIHYWRVLTRFDDGWVTSEVATFTGLSCDAGP